MNAKTAAFLESGVTMPDPESVYIDDSVKACNISPGTVIHPGCRIYGDFVSIGPDCVIGKEGPVTIRDCQLGRNVKVCGGFLENAVLMDYASCGEGTHIRPGSILEEYASTAHTCGLKQTILMPFVTLGSLINFCDVLMSGGTSASNHSEVGSSYIHFNFTPHQDKATASIVGDVPHGVLISQKPVFLGGQGGMVGPRKIAFGTIVGAGSILRKDVDEPNTLVCVPGFGGRPLSCKYDPEKFGDVRGIIRNNFSYIGNLLALLAWYKHCRPALCGNADYTRRCVEGGIARINEGLGERIKQLGKLAAKIAVSADAMLSEGASADEEPIKTQLAFVKKWPEISKSLELMIKEPFVPEASVAEIISAFAANADGYVSAVRLISKKDGAAITNWLSGIVLAAESVFPV